MVGTDSETEQQQEEHNQAQGTTAEADIVIPVQQLNPEQNNASPTSLSRQSSFCIPGTKTVEEVWSHIIRNSSNDDNDNDDNDNDNYNNQPRSDSGNHGPIQNTNLAPPPKLRTFRKMKLEDFLVEAGFVKEPPPQKTPFGMYPNSNAARPVMAGANNAVGLPSDTKPPPASAGGNEGLGVGTSVSPVSLDGMGPNQCGVEMGTMSGQKRNSDCSRLETVVERRQRRIIKNNEWDARSRAKKQARAYTAELEVEMNVMSLLGNQ